MLPREREIIKVIKQLNKDGDLGHYKSYKPKHAYPKIGGGVFLWAFGERGLY